ncbi:DUF262 domain-containing protein [Phycicoccus sp. Soil802]|uniref:DUF262 domain-containing protein n=1 Tax=Phycicoccus sp. Soil802 TaxID=1736414 RepID=UPI00070322AB|nr:DUF262 domain-containing protein [Phycicoccus sp. Soil802]KRF29470.1 hypothetical protein ASG91_00075 [Phycicoccus sp. Soil802]
MKATPLTPAEIFGNQIRYVIPLFQRPYVWNEKDQWAPLWEDVVEVAETVLVTPPPAFGPRAVPPHFLGAVVVEQQHVAVDYISVRGVVDGQQRMTTLQLLMDAAQMVVAQHGDAKDAQALDVLVLNPAQLSSNKDERFKVWPTDRDQEAFRAAMDDSMPVPVALEKSNIVQAHRFFAAQIKEWAEEPADAAKTGARLNALTVALRDFLKIVVIDLEPGDNAQVIFETLNHRGTPLLAADLIKNLVFQSAQAQGLDIRALYSQHWAPLDTDYWREHISQGRLYRPRIDVFMNYWLTMKLLRDVATDRVFLEFRDYLRLSTTPDLGDVLAELARDAETFRQIEHASPSSTVGIFQYRVLRALDSGAVTPFLLWIMSRPAQDCPTEQRDKALRAIESWLARRALCRFTAKGVNLLVVDLLKVVDGADSAVVGDVTESFLRRQEADARLWPSDAQLVTALTGTSVYKNLSRARVRMLLEAIEDDIRLSTTKTEDTLCPKGLTVEHVMPQAWEKHWSLPNDDDPLATDRRNAAVQTLGNLTLVTQSLNPAMSNGPWADTDAQAAGLKEGKKSALLHSVLRLNGDLSKYAAWTEEAIAARGLELATRATRIWPRPVEPVSGDEGAPQAHTETASDPAVEDPSDTSDHEAGVARAERASHSGKYADLYRWLRGQDADEVRSTFGQVEEVIGFPLPESCRTHMAHWYGYDGSAVARAIADAGWRASAVNLAAESVTFVRI